MINSYRDTSVTFCPSNQYLSIPWLYIVEFKIVRSVLQDESMFYVKEIYIEHALLLEFNRKLSQRQEIVSIYLSKIANKFLQKVVTN